jgi:hypothetical protein
VRSHFLGMLQRAIIAETGSDAGPPKRMITDLRVDANRRRQRAD